MELEKSVPAIATLGSVAIALPFGGWFILEDTSK